MVTTRDNIKLAGAQTKTLQTQLDAAHKDNFQLFRSCAQRDVAVTKLKVIYTL